MRERRLSDGWSQAGNPAGPPYVPLHSRNHSQSRQFSSDGFPLMASDEIGLVQPDVTLAVVLVLCVVDGAGERLCGLPVRDGFPLEPRKAL